MKTRSIYEAKTQFSSLVREVERGESIVISRSGKPVARLVPIEKQKRRGAGMDEGVGFIAEDFNEPLPPEVLENFYK